MSEFRIPQVSPLLGSTLGNFLKVLHGKKVDPAYYLKVFLTTLIVLIATPFHWWEKLYFRKKIPLVSIEKAPLFIIGHWRSGTTLLHNLLCSDPIAAYVTTYQSVFPNNLKSKWLFKNFMRLNMPEKRPSDNMALNVNLPQEDEYALSNSQSNTFYNFFYFPKYNDRYFSRAVRHEGLEEKELEEWYHGFDLICKKAMINTGGSQLVLKNPVNTARIKHILNLYPNAKFLYIYRNPYTVFLSTQRFFQKLLPTLWLQKVDFKVIDEIIIQTYKKLLADYEEQKKLIPSGNLMELKFEDFEAEPGASLKTIYKQLLTREFKDVEQIYQSKINELKTYSKNSYSMDKSLVDRISSEWKKYIEMYNYSIPEDISIQIEK